jgi:DNA-binding MarR family transcriptional regulator
MHDDERIHRVIQQSVQVFRCLHSGQVQAWMNVDLTMPQLKALMCVHQSGDATSGQIARSLGVSLSTVTGIVDRLSEQGLVIRHEDPEDRRITRVRPTPGGGDLVSRLLRYRDERLTSLLACLSPDELETVERAFDDLARAALRLDEFSATPAPVGA